MVGVPTSKGCALCLKRAVKCDETRPSCSQCRRGGRKCPGYARGLIFVNETARFGSSEKSGRLRRGRDSASADKHDAPSGYHGGSVKSRCDAILNWQPQSTKAEYDQILASFISAMFPLGAISVQKSFIGSWLWHLPPRIGHFAALDHAALSLALAYFARTSNDQLLLRRAQNSYGLALKALAAAIADRAKAYDAATLCATLLLQFYEAMVHQTRKWIIHAGGAARLMQLRGAQLCYQSPFEYSMFLACRGSMISAALASGEPCFLDTAQWRAVPDGLIDFPLLPDTHQLDHEIFGHFAAIPGLLKDMKQTTGVASESDCQTPLARAQQLRRDIKYWRELYVSSDDDLRMPRLVMWAPHSASEDQFSLKYIFNDVASACLLIASDAYSIVLNQGIDNLQSTADHVQENHDLAEAICMSADYCWQAGYCGSEVMTFSLPIANSALLTTYRGCAQFWIDRFSGRLKALRIQPEWLDMPDQMADKIR